MSNRVPTKRILIDCSDTYINNLHTGIQRVVRNIVERRDLMEKILGLNVVPVVLTRFGYISLDDFLRLKTSAKKQSLKKKVQDFAVNKFKNDYLYTILKLMWYIYSRFSYSFFSLINSFAKKPNYLIEPNNGDMLFLIDAFWQPVYSENKSFMQMVKKFKKLNNSLILLIYDAIPITNPDFVDRLFANKFLESFQKLLPFFDVLLTISKSEKSILSNLIQHIGVKKPIEYFYLGSDLKAIDEKNFAEQDKQFSQYFLMVGTIEPRKGYDVVFEAFEELWRDGFDKQLVIVGKIGWGVDKILKHILKSPYYNKKIFMFNNAKDSELSRLYNNAQALIFASKREGFGLPLVEAIQKRIPVLASDIDVFREIGKDYPVYFNPNDPNDLIEKIKLLGEQLNNKEKTSNSYALNWDDSIKMLCEKINKLLK